MVAEQEQTLEERHAAARARWLAHYEGDPEMQEIVRKAKFDTESTPEEDAEDIRIANERRDQPTRPYEDVVRELAEKYPDEAEYLLADL